MPILPTYELVKATDTKVEYLPAQILKVKRLLKDEDFYLALLPVLAYFDPKLAKFLVENWPLLAPYILLLAGRLGIRITGVHSTGKAIAATPPTPITAAVTTESETS